MASMDTLTWRLKVNTAAATPVLSTAEAKTHMRVTSSAEDTYIATLVLAATGWAEAYTRKQFITATYELYIDDEFPDIIYLPRPPAQSITSLKYLDSDGTLQTLTVTTDYVTDVNHVPGFIIPAYNASWPTVRTTINAVQVIYKAGYGDAATAVPDDIVHAVSMVVAHLFEHREAYTDGKAITDVPLGAKALLDPYVVVW